jgi:hypothetical protein
MYASCFRGPRIISVAGLCYRSVTMPVAFNRANHAPGPAVAMPMDADRDRGSLAGQIPEE